MERAPAHDRFGGFLGATGVGLADAGGGGDAGGGDSIDLRRTGFAFLYDWSSTADSSQDAAKNIAWTVNGSTYRPRDIQIQYGPNGVYAQPGSFDPATEMYQIFTWVPGPSPANPNATLYMLVPPDVGEHVLSTDASLDRPYVLVCSSVDSEVGCSRLSGTVTVERINVLGDTSIPRVPAIVDMSVNLSGARVVPGPNNSTTVDLPVTGQVEICVDQGHSSTGCQQVSGGSLVTGKDRGETDSGAGGGTSGFACLSGTWRRSICNGTQQATVTFSGGQQGTGTFSDVDCTASCTRSFTFNYNATSESSMTIQYTGGQICGTPTVPNGGTQAWSCTNNQLTFGNLYNR